MDAHTIQKITDIEGLRAFLSSHPELGARDAMLAHYAGLGMSLGFTSSRGAPLLAHGTTIGKIDCVWSSNRPVVAFELELGEKEEALSALWKLAELGPELAVIITNSGDSLDTTKSVILRSQMTRALNQMFLLFEIETGRSELINKRPQAREHERRKLIHGTRHEHKEQD